MGSDNCDAGQRDAPRGRGRSARALAVELDDICDAVRADLGQRDRAYITRVIVAQRQLELAGRALLLGARFAPAAIAGTALLSLAKVVENMEIGHNVMHGQWDWMQDPAIHSSAWEWDAASTAASWKHAHNFQHHTYTNVLGRDRDLGYSAMRVEPAQSWHPIYLAQPLYFFLMAVIFEWAIAVYDLELDAVRRGEKSRRQGAPRGHRAAAQGARPAPEGLRAVSRAGRPPGRAPRADRQRRRKPDSQHVGAHHRLLRTHP